MPATVASGASLGVLARAAGVDALAAVDVGHDLRRLGAVRGRLLLGAGGTAAAAIGAAVLLNGRYVPMAVAASGAFRGGPVRRLLRRSCR